VNFIRKHTLSIKIVTSSIVIILGIWYYFCLPTALFPKQYSTVLEDANGQLLGARIATDEQWRFPHNDSLPDKLSQAIITFEDKRFYKHIGIDFLALGRAIKQNFNKNKIVSGASTISMQVIRMHRKGQARTIIEKIIEIILATRLELRYSKAKILALYLCNTPYGGNVVGMDAAAWKYYGRNVYSLSWAEVATLAVLPNSPALIHPGKNRKKLLQKRNRLLKSLENNGVIEKLTYKLAITENLPNKPLPLPSYTPHLLEENRKNNHNSIVKTTIERSLQKKANHILKQHIHRLQDNGIENMAALVIRPSTGKIVAYVGNIPDCKQINSCQVDMIHAHRSTGSIIKPILYSIMIDEGKLTPSQLIPDIPMYFHNFSPKNYDKSYKGSVKAQSALAQSLNIPFTYLLQKYSYQKFYFRLKKMGFSTLNKPSSHYGLSLILGGAETTIWDLGRIYSNMARSLIDFELQSGKVDVQQFRNITYKQTDRNIQYTDQAYLDVAAIWNTFDAMLEVNRPGQEQFWRNFSSKQKIAWKTGTSFGFRDAWAVGISPEFVVVTWVGNADGEGRPNIIGARAAGPIMFDIFNTISKKNTWFTPPYDALHNIIICKQSGHIALPHCEFKDTIQTTKMGLNNSSCPHCQLLHLNKEQTQQVNSTCYSPTEMLHKSYFILPPQQEWYYKSHHPEYKPKPPFSPECETISTTNLSITYPNVGTKIYIPIGIDGNKSSVIFKAKHNDPNATLFWHIDQQYHTSTTQSHEIVLDISKGNHILTVVDNIGESKSVAFQILSETKN